MQVVTLALVALAAAAFLAAPAAAHGGAASDHDDGDDVRVVCQPADHHDTTVNDSEAADGCEYHVVQNAVNASHDGDTVYVREGTYYQAVTVPEPANLTLAGDGRDETVLVSPNEADHHHDDGGNQYGTNNPFADPVAYAEYVAEYPGVWAQDHAENPDGRALMHVEQAENFTGVDTPLAQHEHEHVTYDAVYVTADNVTVRDLEVRDFGGNGVYYNDVVDFHVTRVDAIDNGGYGIYAIRSTLGVFEDSYAEGHYDSGFYLGEVNRCECIVRNVTAAENLIGYSGTGAGYIHIVDSTWRDNAAGIVPNVIPSEPAYQTNLEVTDNLVVDNNNRTAFRDWHFAGSLHAPVGTGVVIGGGSYNTVENNDVRNHSYAGVAITYMFTEPNGNAVIENDFAENDLDVWWDGGGANNCFANNDGSNGSVSYDAGAYWNARGSLPACDGTPNAGAPDPDQLSEMGSLVVFGCYPSELPDGERCHAEEPEPHVHPPASAGFAVSGDEAAELLFGPVDLQGPGEGAEEAS